MNEERSLKNGKIQKNVTFALRMGFVLNWRCCWVYSRLGCSFWKIYNLLRTQKITSRCNWLYQNSKSSKFNSYSFLCDYNHKTSHLVERASCMWATLRHSFGVRVKCRLALNRNEKSYAIKLTVSISLTKWKIQYFLNI